MFSYDTKKKSPPVPPHTIMHLLGTIVAASTTTGRQPPHRKTFPDDNSSVFDNNDKFPWSSSLSCIESNNVLSTFHKREDEPNVAATTTGLVFYLGSKLRPVRIRGMELEIQSSSTNNDELSSSSSSSSSSLLLLEQYVQVYVSKQGNGFHYSTSAGLNLTQDFVPVVRSTSTSTGPTTTTPLLSLLLLRHPTNPNRALIPAHAFTTIEMDRLTRYTLVVLLQQQQQQQQQQQPEPNKRPPHQVSLRYQRQAGLQDKEQATENSDNRLSLFVGSQVAVVGLQQGDNLNNDMNLLLSVDTSIPVVFAGALYYDSIPETCQANSTTTPSTQEDVSLELLFVVDQILASTDYRQLEDVFGIRVQEWLATTATTTSAIATQQHDEDIQLWQTKAFFRNYGGGSASASANNKCVNDSWMACYHVVIQCTFRIQHNSNSNSNNNFIKSRLQKAFYDKAPTFASIVASHFDEINHLRSSNVAVDAAAAKQEQPIQYFYLGYESVQAQFAFTLTTTTATPSLDAVQKNFVATQILEYLNQQFPILYAQLFDVVVDDDDNVDEDDNDKENKLLGGEQHEWTLSGYIVGGQIAVLQNADFAMRIQNVLLQQGTTNNVYNAAGKDQLVQLWRYNANLPLSGVDGGMMAQNRHQLFDDIVQISKVSITPDTAAIPVDWNPGDCPNCPELLQDLFQNDNSNNNLVGAVVDSFQDMNQRILILVLSVVVPLLALTCLGWWYLKQARLKQERRERQAERRRRRRQFNDKKHSNQRQHQQQQRQVTNPESTSPDSTFHHHQRTTTTTQYYNDTDNEDDDEDGDDEEKAYKKYHGNNKDDDDDDDDDDNVFVDEQPPPSQSQQLRRNHGILEMHMNSHPRQNPFDAKLDSSNMIMMSNNSLDYQHGTAPVAAPACPPAPPPIHPSNGNVSMAWSIPQQHDDDDNDDDEKHYSHAAPVTAPPPPPPTNGVMAWSIPHQQQDVEHCSHAAAPVTAPPPLPVADQPRQNPFETLATASSQHEEKVQDNGFWTLAAADTPPPPPQYNGENNYHSSQHISPAAAPTASPPLPSDGTMAWSIPQTQDDDDDDNESKEEQLHLGP